MKIQSGRAGQPRRQQSPIVPSGGHSAGGSTRRHLIALAATLLVGSSLLSGCAAGSEEAQDAPTREVTDVEGTRMDVPVEPQRVVTLSEPTLDGALALGITPVGTVAGRGQSAAPAYLGDAAAEIPVLGTIANPDYEAIATADPDLILVDGTSINNAEVMGVLRKIAPTYYAGYAGGSWRATFGQVALALNQVEAGETVQDDYDAHVRDVAATLTDQADETFSIVRWQGGSASVILKELPAGMALEDLGLARPAGQDRRGRGHSEPVSLENLAEIDADHMFFGTLGGASEGNRDAGGASDAESARAALADAREVPGFSTLAAVRNDQVYVVDGSLWTSTGGPLLMRGLVDSVKENLS
ncbi:iron-siderophore ABC transporter substrate-binding protein [Nocardioides yefusunii]|uniref:ABC transporter substrate-binding protein n=1 Tax=Nocardioides yefusunii TaxID=2500546 RepID=A0ABW1R237_9ACTN|nr:iron-siderophore ABC transporter substrate-binding protein [Nocardioides yefusunii]